MQRLKVIFRLICRAVGFAVCTLSVAAAQTSTIHNEDIVKMVQSGVAQDIVISTIAESDSVDFLLTPGYLVALKQAGVPDAIVRAMAARQNGHAIPGYTPPTPAPPRPPAQPAPSSLPAQPDPPPIASAPTTPLPASQASTVVQVADWTPATSSGALDAPQNAVSFDDVEIRTTYAKAREGDTGHLTVFANKIVFSKKPHGEREYFAIPTNAVKELFYSRVSGRRIGAAIAITPLLLFSKGRKHYMTISFDDGRGAVGAAEFKLHKHNYRPILRSLETACRIKMQYDQEGIKDSEQKPAGHR